MSGVAPSAVDLPLAGEFEVVGDLRKLSARRRYLTGVSVSQSQ